MGAEVISKMSEFEAVTPKPRSIPTTFVFGEVRKFTIEQLCNGEVGGGAMGEMELARIADRRACARRASLTNTDRWVGGVFIPWRAVREAEASAPSRAWSPGRRDLPQGRGAHPSCSRLGFRFMPASLALNMRTTHQRKGKTVINTEHTSKTPRSATGFFAVLGAFLCIAGSGASAALPASASAYATPEAPPVYSSAPGLPDGRVYELASPPNKDGNEAGASSLLFTGPVSGSKRYAAASGEGDSVLFEGTGPMGETASPDSLFFVATRTGSGWKTRSLAPSQEQSAAELGPVSAHPSDLDISPDFSHAMIEGPATLAPLPKACEEFGGFFLTGPDPFVPAIWLDRPEIDDPVVKCPGAGAPAGGTPNFSTVYFSAPGPQLPEDSSRVEGDGFYEYREGLLHEAGVLPDGSLSPFGAVSTTAEHISGNPVSADGSRAFFVSPDPAAVGSCEATEEGKGDTPAQAGAACAPQLYVREDGTRTLLVSKDTLLPEVGGLPAAAPGGVLPVLPLHQKKGYSYGAYVFASSDGSQAFFQSADQLTSQAPEGPPGNTTPKTYDFDLNTGVLTYLPNVMGKIVATDTEGTSFAFVRPAAGGEPAELDLWSGPGAGRVTPVVQLPGGEEVEPARISSDGSVLVFLTASEIPGFNDPASTHLGGHGGLFANEQIFRYDAQTNTLGCISCSPAGVAPGWASISILKEGLTSGYSAGDAGVVEERGISSNGDRVFFQSDARLVPQVTNTGTTVPSSEHLGTIEQGVNVYEWENGVVYLLNAGKSGRDTYFLDNSESGNDVFFATTEELVPSDTDGGYSVYDARVPRPGDNPPATAVPCEGSVCQGPPNVPSPLTPPASATFSGLGNPTPEVTPPTPKTATKTVKCKKGFTKKNNKCVKDKKKKTKAKKASHNGRGK
jgi:hypothetical protein